MVDVYLLGVGVRPLSIRIVPAPRSHLAAASHIDVLSVTYQGGFSCIAGGLGRVPAEVFSLAPVAEPLARVTGHRSRLRNLEFLQGFRRLGRGACSARAGAGAVLFGAYEPYRAASHYQDDEEDRCEHYAKLPRDGRDSPASGAFLYEPSSSDLWLPRYCNLGVSVCGEPEGTLPKTAPGGELLNVLHSCNASILVLSTTWMFVTFRSSSYHFVPLKQMQRCEILRETVPELVAFEA